MVSDATDPYVIVWDGEAGARCCPPTAMRPASPVTGRRAIGLCLTLSWVAFGDVACFISPNAAVGGVSEPQDRIGRLAERAIGVWRPQQPANAHQASS